MNLSTIPRTALGGYLKAIRIPVDIVARRRGDAAALAVDRAEATIRGFAGSLLSDPELSRDAVRRHRAADEREEALRLAGQAKARRERADERTSETVEQAARQRKDAAQEAERRREGAAQKRAQKQQQAAELASKRKEGAAKAAAVAEERSEAEARAERLDQLETKQEALEEKDRALTAEDEAERLAAAAGRVKSARRDS